MATKSNNSKDGRETGVSKNTKKEEGAKSKGEPRLSKAGERDLDRNQDQRYGDDMPRRLTGEHNGEQNEHREDEDTDSRGEGNRNNGNRNNSQRESARSDGQPRSNAQSRSYEESNSRRTRAGRDRDEDRSRTYERERS